MSDSLLAAGADSTEPVVTATEPVVAELVVTATEPVVAEPVAEPVVVEGAPETYAEFTAAEGTTLAPELVTEASALAKELGLSQDKAQKIVDLAAKGAPAALAAQAQAVETVRAEWIAATRADKEFGGDKLNENLAKAQAAMKATCSPQLQMLLDRSGLGNNAEVIRHFLQIAPAFASDKFVEGGKPTKESKTAAQVMYPTATA